MSSIEARRCGDCTVCCIVPAIETPELSKPAGVTCPNCAAGCRIYDVRPQACRDFFCGWRALGELDDAWRPDRSGVLLVEDAVGVPAGYAARVAFKFILIAALSDAMADALAAFLLNLTAGRQPVFLAVTDGGDGAPAKCLLNPALEAAAGDLAAARGAIAEATARLKA